MVVAEGHSTADFDSVAIDIVDEDLELTQGELVYLGQKFAGYFPDLALYLLVARRSATDAR